MVIEKKKKKKRKLQAFFISNPQSSFYESPYFQNLVKCLTIPEIAAQFIMKQSNQNLILISENARTLRQAQKLLLALHERVKEGH